MRLLDLFCGAGGAAMGYSRAGFDEIVGVDIVGQKNYPFAFIQGDALNPPVRLEDFDLIHASPPCQAYSVITLNPEKHPDLIAPTRRLLQQSGRPYLIENVAGAPLFGYVRLCGSMFGLDVQRHRYFELSFPVMSLACNHKAWRTGPWLVTGHIHTTAQHSLRHRKPAIADVPELMGMLPGMPREAYTEAIPPAYTEYLGRQFLDQLARA